VNVWLAVEQIMRKRAVEVATHLEQLNSEPDVHYRVDQVLTTPVWEAGEDLES
jgi:hypothetical protein